MSDVTFLTKEQCENLEALKIRGKEAAMTDYAILLGGRVYPEYHIDGDNSLEGRAGDYWTKSSANEHHAYIIASDGEEYEENTHTDFTAGVRPVLSVSSIDSIPNNEEGVQEASDGVSEVEFGYYPQKAASKELQAMLENAYDKEYLEKTTNNYTANMYRPLRLLGFFPEKHQEYKYMEKRYVRVKVSDKYSEKKPAVLSNGEVYKNGDNVWIEVSPLKWIVDKYENIMFTEKLPLAGVQFLNKGPYKEENFEKTDIMKYMNKYFLKDLEQLIREKEIDISEKNKQGIQGMKTNYPVQDEIEEHTDMRRRHSDKSEKNTEEER